MERQGSPETIYEYEYEHTCALFFGNPAAWALKCEINAPPPIAW